MATSKIQKPIKTETFTPTIPDTIEFGAITFKKFGNVVCIGINNVVKAEAGSNIICTLPVAWRPSQTLSAIIVRPSSPTPDNAVSLRIYVRANGVVELYNYRDTAITASTNSSGTLTFVVDDI